MNKTTIVVVVILVIGVIIGCGIWNDGSINIFNKYKNKSGDYGMMDMNGGDYMMGGKGMMGMDGHMMGMSVSSEKEFIEGMIPHHQEAVDTAKEVIARGGTTPEIKELVENIVVAQEAEIADMKEWYKSWYGKDYVDTNQYQPMMRDLENLSGKEIDEAFLKDMIMHHMGAIMMAQSVQSYIEHEEITNLTEAIVRTQSEEIMQMRLMLESL